MLACSTLQQQLRQTSSNRALAHLSHMETFFSFIFRLANTIIVVIKTCAGLLFPMQKIDQESTVVSFNLIVIIVIIQFLNKNICIILLSFMLQFNLYVLIMLVCRNLKCFKNIQITSELEKHHNNVLFFNPVTIR